MYFLILGVLLLAAKMAGVGPTADWSWWLVLAPFALTVAWWAFADASGLTQRRAMQRMDERKQARREKAVAALGLGATGRRPGGAPEGGARRSPPEPGGRDAAEPTRPPGT